MKKKLGIMGLSLALLMACSSQQKESLTLSGLNPADFETLVDGTQAVKLYTLKNASGMEVCITNFGGRLVSVMVPDKNGQMTDVILGFDNISDYQNIPSDFGASIGRYANRINQGKIVVDGVEYQLPQNNYGHCLHGGPEGWQYKVYEAKQLGDSKLELVLNSPDGDSNFPGNVVAKVTYTLTDDNAIDIAYEATTDKKTIIIDAGHGGEDGGAIGKNGTFEKDINLKIAKKLYSKLTDLNIKCILTRDTDILLYDRTQDYQGRKKALDMQARKRIAESYDNAIFISIHQNSFPEERYSGFQAYYSTNSSASRALATLIENSIRTSLQPNNHRASKASGGNIYLLDNLQCTAILLECGFLSNNNECELLCTETYQNELCDIIASTVFEFIKTSRV